MRTQDEDIDLFQKIIDVIEKHRPDLEPLLEGGGAAAACFSVKNLAEGEGQANSRWFLGYDEHWGGQLILEDGDTPNQYISTDIPWGCEDINELVATFLVELDPKLIEAATKAMFEAMDYAPIPHDEYLYSHHALDAAWEPVVKAFPKITTGDMAIDLELDLMMKVDDDDREALPALLKQGIRHWLESNMR